MDDAPLAPEAFVARLREEGGRRYHDQHPFHRRMHEGELTRREIQAWVAEPLLLPDAHPDQGRDHPLEVRGSGLPARVDPPHPRPRRRARGRGRARALAAARRGGRPRPRRGREPPRACCPACASPATPTSRSSASGACSSAVASSLTEFFAPDIMSKRIAAWEQHYPWVEAATLDVLPSRVPRARARRERGARLRRRPRDDPRGPGALRRRARDRKCEILWALLDAIARPTAPRRRPPSPARSLHGGPRAARRPGSGGARRPSRPEQAAAREEGVPTWDRFERRTVLLYPERGLALNATAAAAVVARLRRRAHRRGDRRRARRRRPRRARARRSSATCSRSSTRCSSARWCGPCCERGDDREPVPRPTR